MIIESIYDFLREGALKNIPFGVKRQFLKEVLADTDWVYTAVDDVLPSVYKYDVIEFHFMPGDHSGLVGITSNFITDAANTVNFKLFCDEWSAQSTPESIERLLVQHGVSFVSRQYAYDDAWEIYTEGDVSILFSKEDGQFLLEKIGRFI